MTTRALIVAAIAATASYTAASAQWNHFIINYGNSHNVQSSQTWQISPLDDQWVFFANRGGVLQYDGDTWQEIPLKNGSYARSVRPSALGDRIYVGGINEYGYIDTRADGTPRYNCLSDSLDASLRYIGNVWGVHETDNIIYFQGDERVVKYIGGRYSLIEANAKIDCSNIVNGSLYVGTDRGIMVLIGNTFFPFQGADELRNKRIRGIAPYGKGLLVATAYSGLYICNGQTTTKLTTGVEDFMRKYEVFCMATQGNKIALGTVHKGIVVIDLASGETQYFNENHGLRNNTVISAAFDSDGNLWAGLDSGIDLICLNTPYTNLYTYPNSYGAGYTAAVGGDILYLGTNRGLYYTRYPVAINEHLPDIHAVEGSSGQVWNICRIDNELFCLHDRGMFLLDGLRLKQITNVWGVWTCQKVLGHPNTIFACAYHGIFLLEKGPDGWINHGKIDGINASSRAIEQDSNGDIWIGANDHIVRYRLSDDLMRITEEQEFWSGAELPVGNSLSVTKIDGAICFTTAQGIYQWNKNDNRMEPCTDLNNRLNGKQIYTYITSTPHHLLSLSDNEVCISNNQTYKQGSQSVIVPLKRTFVKLIQSFENLIPISDTLIVMPHENGFALLNTNQINRSATLSNTLRIRSAHITYPKDSLIYTSNFSGLKNTPKLSYANNSVRFKFSVDARSELNHVNYQYRLNDDVWSDYTSATTKEYSDLAEGDYTFEVKAVFDNGQTVTDSLKFVIKAPWYRTGMAYTAYAMIFVLICWAVRIWDTHRVQYQKDLVVVEKDNEMKRMENAYEKEKEQRELQIMQLEKEKLTYDLQFQNQKLSNLMISFASKTEMLNEIKQEIQKVSATLRGDGNKEAKQQLILLNNKIDSNIDGDDVLQRIEEQFDLVHSNFMKQLQAKHPDLSKNERMMCAYLKMELSTKEIAPLLNISVRGVETIRYRLRKKIGLQQQDNLTDYLMHLA